jgi:tRNA-uridine 2-sulfurtransferase
VSALTASEASWVDGTAPQTPFHCHAKIRYRQADQECVIEKIEGDKVFVTFPKPQRAVTPRQSIVFYKGPACLGGALINPTHS